MIIRGHDFDTLHHTYIMGILNVTPDSFSDGGNFQNPDAALFHAEQMLKEGADIIDIGGESTRPGHTQISDLEEIERILPVVRAVRERFDAVISVDTYKSSVAAAALSEGADLINDIWGLRYDPRMAPVIAQAGAACCLMHNRSEALYSDFLTELCSDLSESVRIALSAGISGDRIILDPGVGFGKTTAHNLSVLHSLDTLHALSYPLLLGCSRKSVIGNTLSLPAGERLEGTLVTTVFAVLSHYAFVRVHDVRENLRAIRMAEAIRDAGRC